MSDLRPGPGLSEFFPDEDDRLVVLLGDVLAIDLVEPPGASIASLRAAVQARWPGDRVRRLRRAPAWLIPVVSAAVVCGGAGAAAASGAALPAPLRTAARAVGLPVESAAVASAKSTEAHLRHALETHDPSSAAHWSAQLNNQVNSMNTEDRQEVTNTAVSLLNRAKTIEQTGPSTAAPPTSPGTGHAPPPAANNPPAPSNPSEDSSPAAGPPHPANAEPPTTEPSSDSASHGGGGHGGDASHGGQPPAPGD